MFWNQRQQIFERGHGHPVGPRNRKAKVLALAQQIGIRRRDGGMDAPDAFALRQPQQTAQQPGANMQGLPMAGDHKRQVSLGGARNSANAADAQNLMVQRGRITPVRHQ